MKSLMMILISCFVFSAYSQDSASPAESTPAVDSSTSTNTSDLGEVTGIEKYRINCKNGSDEREIKVITQEDKSVGVTYKKFDSVKTVAIARVDLSYADQVAERIKTNLEGSGFTCESTQTDVGAKEEPAAE